MALSITCEKIDKQDLLMETVLSENRGTNLNPCLPGLSEAGLPWSYQSSNFTGLALRSCQSSLLTFISSFCSSLFFKSLFSAEGTRVI